MEKMNCLVVDDEAMGRKLLEENIRQLPFLHLQGTCKNAFEALEFLQNHSVDLVFSDIQMPGMLGTQFLQSLKQKPLFIFVTAYDQFAVESYALDAIDYLMKPVSLERFTAAALKAQQAWKQSPLAKGKTDLEDYFFINVEYALVKIEIPKILFIEGLKDYVKIYLEGERHPVLTKITMKALEQKVGSHGFLRVHKSFIVNLRRIESLKQQRIKLGAHDIPVSDSHLAELMDHINLSKA